MLVRELRTGDRSAGPPLLLLHGWLLSADINWFPLYAGFARHGRVLAMDVRGHGRGIRSQERFTLEDAADDAAALLQHLDAAPAVVVGYSMGGSIALLLQQRHPTTVAGLVLHSTALEWREQPNEHVLWHLMGALDWSLRAGVPRRVAGRYLARAARANAALGDVVPWLAVEAFRGNAADLAEAGRALGAFDARAWAPLVDVPTAVVVSTRDRLVAPWRQYGLAKTIPGAATVQADIGHNGWLVQPDRLGVALDEAVERVLARLLPRQGAFGAGAARADPATARTLRR
jgi:pimeloyl-ACP methyl ester carboxylesterase